MRRLIYSVVVISLLLLFIPGEAYCNEVNSKYQVNLDYLTPIDGKHDLDTISVHILTKISETKARSIYRGLTITRPHGDTTLNKQTYNNSAVGVGPIYMVRYEKQQSAKFSTALDISGGFIVYDKVFPAGGRYYNFMWRIGPQFIYKANENSSINIGYMLMHVSNGFGSHNPGYDAHGVSLGFVTKF